MPTKRPKTTTAAVRSLLATALAAVLAVTLTACGSTNLSPYIVSGTVTDALGNPMEGVTITLSGGWSDRTTDENGEWSAELTGDVTVEPSQVGWAFAPSSESVDATASGVDFTMTLSDDLESQIVYVRDFSIYTLNIDGSRTALTGSEGMDQSPDWSPDGSEIAFISSRDGNSRMTHVMQADGSGITGVGADFDGGPDWSPDGSQLVVSASSGGNADIAVMNADGSSRQVLNVTSSHDADPVWSSDGSQIAFVTYVDPPGQYDLHIMDADGSNVQQITSDDQYETNLDWSWSLDEIAYGADGGVHTVNPDGSNLTELVSEDSGSPAWSPSGSQIVFTDFGGPQNELFLMNSDGSEVHQLSFGGGEDPDW